MIDLILGRPPSTAVDRSLAHHTTVHAPHLIDLEVLNVLRSFRARGAISDERAVSALKDFYNLRVVRHAHVPLRGRIWQLGDRLTSYDAAYVALAEMLPAALVTTDGRLARTATGLVDVTHAA